MVAFMHTGTRLTAGYRYTTLGDATPFPPVVEGSAFLRHRCFLVEETGVDDPEVVQAQCPFARLFHGGDPRQLQRSV